MENNNKKNTSNMALTIIGVILCMLMIPVIMLNISLIIRRCTNPDEIPSIGSKIPLIYLVDSMAPELQSGDLLICRTEESENIQVGDIIAFFDPAGNGMSIRVHRVIEVIDNDGEIEWITQGDANNTEDADPIPETKLVGVYESRIPKLGNIVMFVQSVPGMILCVICPILLFVIYDAIRRKKYTESLKNDTDALTKELAELRALKGQQSTEGDNP